jgi:hypothetical protein
MREEKKRIRTLTPNTCTQEKRDGKLKMKGGQHQLRHKVVRADLFPQFCFFFFFAIPAPAPLFYEHKKKSEKIQKGEQNKKK